MDLEHTCARVIIIKSANEAGRETSDPIGYTRRRSRWTGNEWHQSIGSGSAERAAIYRIRPTVAEPCRQLKPRPAIAAREPRRQTTQGLESRAGVDPFQTVRGRLASRRGHREGANRPGRNGIFGLSNLRPRRHGHCGLLVMSGSAGFGHTRLALIVNDWMNSVHLNKGSERSANLKTCIVFGIKDTLLLDHAPLPFGDGKCIAAYRW